MLLDNRAYVAKVDLKLDSMSKHNLSVRTTIADNARDLALAQYPGAVRQLASCNTSYGVGASYTGRSLRPNLINTANFGLTNIRMKRTGTLVARFHPRHDRRPERLTRAVRTLGADLQLHRRPHLEQGHAHADDGRQPAVRAQQPHQLRQRVSGFLAAASAAGPRLRHGDRDTRVIWRSSPAIRTSAWRRDGNVTRALATCSASLPAASMTYS